LKRIFLCISCAFLWLIASPAQASLQNILDLEDATGNVTIEGDSMTISPFRFSVSSVEQPLYGEVTGNPDTPFNFQVYLAVFGDSSWSPYPTAFEATIDFTASWNQFDSEVSDIKKISASGIGDLSTVGALIEIGGWDELANPSTIYLNIEIHDTYFEQFGRVQDTLSSASYGNIKAEAVPIPAAVWLLGSGMFGLAYFRRKFHR
jgi:hypothetical protein